MSALVLASVAAGAFVGIIIYVAVVVFLIAALWLVFAEGRSARMGRDHSLLQLLHDAQGGRPTGMVAGPAISSPS